MGSQEYTEAGGCDCYDIGSASPHDVVGSRKSAWFVSIARKKLLVEL